MHSGHFTAHPLLADANPVAASKLIGFAAYARAICLVAAIAAIQFTVTLARPTKSDNRLVSENALVRGCLRKLRTWANTCRPPCSENNWSDKFV